MDNNIQSSKTILYNAHKSLILNNDPKGTIQYLENVINQENKPETYVWYWLGLCHLENGNYIKAKKIFLSVNAFYQAGFSELLAGSYHDAIRLWNKSNDSPQKRWAKSLESILKGYIEYIPSFLGIRNNLEMDLGYLLRAKQISYAENIIKIIDDLADINLEAYKFVGKALLYNGFPNDSVKYLLEGQSILPNDPEVYYHLGQYSLIVKAYAEAQTMFEHCLIINPSYTPANDCLNDLKMITGN